MKRLIILYFLCAAACLGDDTWARSNGDWFRDGGNWGRSAATSTPVAWTDTNSATAIMMLYAQDPTPTRVWEDHTGDTSETFMLGANDTTPVFGGTNNGLYFTDATFLINSNMLSRYGSVFSNITIMGWHKQVTANEGCGLFGLDPNQGGVNPEFGAFAFNGNWDVRLDRGAKTLSTAGVTTNWTHLAFTYNLTNFIVYTDGTQTNSTAYSTTLTATDSKALIGELASGFPGHGFMKDIRWYTRAVSSAEVFTVSQAGHTGFDVDVISTNGLTLAYPFTNDHTRLADSSGKYHHMQPRPDYATSPTRVLVGTNTNGRLQYAYNFPGNTNGFRTFIQDQYDGDSPFNIGTNSCAISLWFYLREAPPAGEAAAAIGANPSNPNGWGMYVDGTTGKVRFKFSEGATIRLAEANDICPTNQWCHAYGRRAGGELTLYIDGALQTNVTAEALDVSVTGLTEINFGNADGWNTDGMLVDWRAYIPAPDADFAGVLYTNTLMPNGNIEDRITDR